MEEVDTIVVGGGFYGAAIAIYLAKKNKKILLVERESALMTRASYNNQARIHNGYHYPRSFTTAYRSRINLPKFVRDWPDAVKLDFTKLYAIARRNSKVTAKQFTRFCKNIGAKIEPADAALRTLFEPKLIEDVFMVEEYSFDSSKLALWAQQELQETGVQVILNTQVTGIVNGANNTLKITVMPKAGEAREITCTQLFNCTYSGLNQFSPDSPGIRSGLKQEITEMALIQPPPVLKNLGVTVMDGPFFSMMPFPAKKLHTLSHVRYTPHENWLDARGLNPYDRLDKHDRSTRVERMIRDAARFMPAILDAKYVESLFEIKTVLVKNEGDDGRPILFEKHPDFPGYFSVLGGKIDNIYDILEMIDADQGR